MEFLQFRILKEIPGLFHAVFTRHGGVSHPPYDSLNVAWNNGDDDEAVTENLRRILQSTPFSTLVTSVQVHGTKTLVIDPERISDYQHRPPVRITSPADAMITSHPGIGTYVKIADCQPVLLVDPIRRVAANVHCGWRGTVGGIVPQTMEMMVNRLGCQVGDILAAIGPSLGPCCAEFVHYREELPQRLWTYQGSPCHFNFWRITRDELLAFGISSDHIEVSELCTACHTETFFSYRREKRTGRFAAVIGWTS